MSKALATKADNATIAGCLLSEVWKKQIESVLPKEMVIDAVLRVSRSAIQVNDKLSKCSPQSFLVALLKCARAGLYPDGREAHLIPYGTEVQAIFDWKGLVAMVRRAGVDVTPKLVHENDVFEVEEDDGSGRTKVRHVVDFKKHRGEVVAVWSRAAYPNGRIDYEIMTAAECEKVRQQYSRAKDSEMWVKSPGEAYKKTCIRRHSKRWDMSPELREAINADDDTPNFGALPVTQPKMKPVVEVESVASGIPNEEEPEEQLPIKEVIKQIRYIAANPTKKDMPKIGEGRLMDFIKEVCPISETASNLEDAANESEETIRMVLEQWEDIANRIKSV